jgi:hypothetical protein
MYIFSSSGNSFLLLEQRLANITAPAHPFQVAFVTIVEWSFVPLALEPNAFGSTHRQSWSSFESTS